MAQMGTINDRDNPHWNFGTVWNTNQVEAMPPECKALLNVSGLCQFIHDITINMVIYIFLVLSEYWKKLIRYLLFVMLLNELSYRQDKRMGELNLFIDYHTKYIVSIT